jgi:ubiquitin C-terminal hydrolase
VATVATVVAVAVVVAVVTNVVSGHCFERYLKRERLKST